MATIVKLINGPFHSQVRHVESWEDTIKIEYVSMQDLHDSMFKQQTPPTYVGWYVRKRNSQTNEIAFFWEQNDPNRK